MKKIFSIVLALCVALSLVTSSALVASTTPTNSDPFILASIRVTDIAGYNAPYAAADITTAFAPNQTAYVVVGFQVKAIDAAAGIVALDPANPVREITITSSSLDLTFAASTMKAFSVSDGAIAPIVPVLPTVAADKLVFSTTTTAMNFVQPATGTNSYYYSFIAIVKPATVGLVKGSFKVSPTMFTGNASASTLSVFDANGLKYIIDRTIDATAGDTFTVSTMNGTTKTELFGYKNSAGNAHFGNITFGGAPTIIDYFGHILYTSGASTVDITATVAAVNTFFGFSFTNTLYPVLPAHFEAKTVGNPIVVLDGYVYLNATIDNGDDGIIIAPTGDLSANIIIVLAASAVLAAAALLFVAKKARD